MLKKLKEFGSSKPSKKDGREEEPQTEMIAQGSNIGQPNYQVQQFKHS